MDQVDLILANRPKEKPLFLYVHSIDPHAPYEAPAPHRTAYGEKQHLRVPDALNSKSKPETFGRSSTVTTARSFTTTRSSSV